MASLHNDVFDLGLNELTTDGNELHILSAEPTTYGNVATYTLGNKTTPTISSPADRGAGGREVTITAITNGTVTGTGTVTHYAVIDTIGSRLLAVAALSASQAVTTGNPFTLTQIKIGIPDPT